MSRIKNLSEYQNHYRESMENPDQYWDNLANEFKWHEKWASVQSGSFAEQNVEWFSGGKLNITENCLDRHLETRGNKNAVIFEPNDPNSETTTYTYKELHSEVCKFANILKDRGIKKGDRVCFYMSMVPELLIGVLATARIGAIHSVVFGGFSAMALSGRINDCESNIVITNDGGFRGDKIIPLKDITDEALKTCPTVETVLIIKRTESKINFQEGRDFWYHDLKQTASDNCPAEIMSAEDPLFILYTSGSTGTPKGLLHTCGGYMVYAAHTFQNVFQLEENDIYWCTADIGWVTGHTYITYGPLLNGATTVMFEGVPTYPDAGRFWALTEKHKITHLYTAPTAIRALQACDIDFVNRHDLSSLKVLGSVGEPINEEAWDWYHKNIGKGKCPIVDTWWQTETGGIMISPLAGITELIPSYATTPMPGISPILVDAEGNEIKDIEAEGNLCIDKPWPGIARSIYGDHERYKQTYFSTYPGRYFTGDGARRDSKGNYRITGRVDDVMNVSGHRIGTAEVEDALNHHPNVVESAVVGFPHDIKGQGIYAYLIVQDPSADQTDLRKQLNETINKVIGPIARPDKLQVVSGLPKTRSGKIMRRILRKIASGETSGFGDTSTLLNPQIVEEICSGKTF
jgi:acetyl-CoA synthetase